ncbi:hypothetical protein BJ741DRAFT_681585, partial [Chytriomyces cf. hyalinus JEL632]
DEIRARNQYLEYQVLRAQADWAHSSQDTTKIYAKPQKEYQCRNKASDIVYHHPDKSNLATAISKNILSHHSIKVYMNALVHLFFWQTVDVSNQNSKNPHPYLRGPSIKSFLLKHKEEHEKCKATCSDDAGLDDMALRIDDAKWMELAMSMLKSKKLVEVATLWLDKQAVWWHQLARD